MELLLTYIRQEASDCFSFIFEPLEEFTWQAGQFLEYNLEGDKTDGRGMQRYFSIASAPSEQIIMLTTRFPENPSQFKQNLHSLNIDETINASLPSGSFVLEDLTREYVFIAGGIGITPFRSMIIELSLQQKPVNITLLYANRNDEIIFQQELERIAQEYPSLHIHYFIDPKHIDAQAIKKTVPDPLQKIYYLSGPKPMVESMEQVLETLSISKAQIKTDYFPGYEGI